MAESDAELDDELVPGPDDADDVDADLLPEDENPDEVELEADEAGDDLEDPPPRERRIPPKNQEYINLRKRAQEAEERARRAEELAQRTAGQVDFISRQNPQAEAQRRAEEERVANMSESERFDYFRRKDADEFNRSRAVDNFRADDRFDKLSFETACMSNKSYADVAEEVERRLAEMHRQGTRVDRKILAHVVLGERSATRAVKEGTKVRQRTSEEMARQTTQRPRSRGSDVGAERTSRGSRRNETAEERLARLDVRF